MSLLEKLQAKKNAGHSEQSMSRMEPTHHVDKEEHNGYFLRGDNLYNYARRNEENYSGLSDKEEIEELIRSVSNHKKGALKKQKQPNLAPIRTSSEQDDFFSRALESDFDFQKAKSKE